MNRLLKLLEGLDLDAKALEDAKKLIAETQIKLKTNGDTIKSLEEEIAPYREKAASDALKAKWLEEGGSEDGFEKAQKYGLKEDNIKEMLEDLPELKNETVINDPSTKQSTKQPTNEDGDGEEDYSDGDGSFIIKP